MNIAIIEDDWLQRTALRNWIEEAGHHCSCFDSGNEFTEKAQRNDHQMLLLDWELPGMNGIELLTWLRTELQDNTPVLFITTHDTEEDIVLALNTGADDYLVKPARKQELLARIDALARRTADSNRTLKKHSYGNIQVDNQRHEITLHGKSIDLTQKEFSLACYLLENCGKLLSRSELLGHVWGHASTGQTRTVDTHISRLRKKLALTEENGWQLSAIYQYGYRLDQTGH
ncbi:MAG: response regulator transcription factor [Pseudomonadota bacterium]